MRARLAGMASANGQGRVGAASRTAMTSVPSRASRVTAPTAAGRGPARSGRGGPGGSVREVGDRRGEVAPRGAVRVQPGAAGGGGPVRAAPPAVHDGPGTGDEPGVLQPVQRRIDGTGGQVEA